MVSRPSRYKEQACLWSGRTERIRDLRLVRPAYGGLSALRCFFDMASNDILVVRIAEGLGTKRGACRWSHPQHPGMAFSRRQGRHIGLPLLEAATWALRFHTTNVKRQGRHIGLPLLEGASHACICRANLWGKSCRNLRGLVLQYRLWF